MASTHYYTTVKHTLENSPAIKLVENRALLAETDSISREHVAANLIKFRKKLGLSQEKFAKINEISLSQYKKYETGQESIRLDVGHRITLKCGLPFPLLLRGTRYADFLSLPGEFQGFDQIWFYANSVKDHYFKILCEILISFSHLQVTDVAIPMSGIEVGDFEQALEENRTAIYTAIAHGIKAARHHFGYSQAQIAELLEVSLSAYQEYEKPVERPRFNIFVASRYGISTGIDPFVVLEGTYLYKIRLMQNQRMAAIQNILDAIDNITLSNLPPLVESFYHTVKNIPDSLFFEI